MSLATTGGGIHSGGGAGGGMGGIAMAHQANAVARPAAPNQAHGSVPPGSAAPPPSMAALAVELLDKHQASLSMKQVRAVSHLPLVAVDLYASDLHVAYFPPKPKDPAAKEPAAKIVGKMKPQIHLKPTETAHKTLRKYLTKSKGYENLRDDTLAKSDDNDAVVMERPQAWLGMRRFDQVPGFLRSSVKEEDPSPAIAEEASVTTGVTMANGTLDGSVPQGDDYDRVVYKVRLSTSKKALTMLPEEAVQLLMHQAQSHVARLFEQKGGETSDDDITNYPCAVAIPAWYCRDPTVEAMMDTVGDSDGGIVVYQRSVCALAGALQPGPEGKPNPVLEAINERRTALHKEYQKAQVKDPTATFNEDVMVLLVGLATDGVECTAVQVSSVQPEHPSCLFGNYQVLSSVGYQHENPESLIAKCIEELQSNIETIAPEAGKPVAIVTYGSPQEQKTTAAAWDKVKPTVGKWQKTPVISTKYETVAIGSAVLGAVSHGRLRTTLHVPGKKPKAQLGIRVANVSTIAVGVKLNYHSGKKKRWTDVKTIFDFDRRVPAGPYSMELTAAECAVHRSGEASQLSDEELLKAIKGNEGAKKIPLREEAALAFRVQIMQKWSRDGEWIPVGDSMSPLITKNADEDQTEVALESLNLEISLGATGLITSALVGERNSVVQATKEARNSALRWYLGVLFAVLFFGGFLIKSYWEEAVFERDTKRLLLYYKHTVPGSIADGDERNARYLVWKYRGKKDKLWRSLEKKYGEPVLQTHEYLDIEAAEENSQQESQEEAPEETEDLDVDETASEASADPATEGEEEQEL